MDCLNGAFCSKQWCGQVSCNEPTPKVRARLFGHRRKGACPPFCASGRKAQPVRLLWYSRDCHAALPACQLPLRSGGAVKETGVRPGRDRQANEYLLNSPTSAVLPQALEIEWDIVVHEDQR